MAKTRTTFFCTNCGNESPKWLGKCPSCNSWNTFREEKVTSDKSENGWKSEKANNKPLTLNEIGESNVQRVALKDNEFNRVLGGGIVPGSLVLIGGEPGIGKSTLLLQIALQLEGTNVLYISGEESLQQIKMRASRILRSAPGSETFRILTETRTSKIFDLLKETNPNIVVIDSIQTLESSAVEAVAGSISQVRQCAGELLRFAKETGTPVFLIGHITKDGAIAGPKLLEHMVDTVIQFEGDRHMVYRLLRTIKNRFGSTSELGIYEMNEFGLREVSNPSEILLSSNGNTQSGVGIGATIEGNRPLLIEVQALVSPATYGNPQRNATGYDTRRLSMLLAVLEKRAGYRFGNADVFLNIAGGLRVEDPGIDLAVCAALISSYNDQKVGNDCCFAAEVGLGGELRNVSRLDRRVQEAEKLGFQKIIVAKQGSKIKTSGKLEVVALENIHAVINYLV